MHVWRHLPLLGTWGATPCGTCSVPSEYIRQQIGWAVRFYSPFFACCVHSTPLAPLHNVCVSVCVRVFRVEWLRGGPELNTWMVLGVARGGPPPAPGVRRRLEEFLRAPPGGRRSLGEVPPPPLNQNLYCTQTGNKGEGELFA